MLAERPFQYVPATITGSMPNSFVAIKYEDNTKNPMLWKRTRFDGLTTNWYPDRTLFTGASLQRTSSINNVEYDEIILTGLSTQCESLKTAGFRYGMASPHHTSAAAETRRNKHVKLFSDSGGFQLLSGAVEFIDPVELAEYYNRAIDYGIGLDIPVFGHNDMLMRMIEVMLKNNRLIRKHLKPEVSLYDVSHGSTLKTRQEFLERLLKEKDLGDSLAVGGIAQNYKDGGQPTTIISGTINMMYTLLRSKGTFKRYHILGTTSSFFQALYWLIQEHDAAPHITADSTSYILPAANNLTVTNRMTGDCRLVSTEVPKDIRGYSLQCACPVCNMVKYPIAYVHYAHINSYHNLFTISENYKLIETMCREFLDGKISMRVLAEAVGGPKQAILPVMEAAFKFGMDAARKGFKHAYEKHSPTLKHLVRGKVQTGALFSKTQEVQLNETQQKTRQRLDTVLTKYEDYHKATKRKVKT